MDPTNLATAEFNSHLYHLFIRIIYSHNIIHYFFLMIVRIFPININYTFEHNSSYPQQSIVFIRCMVQSFPLIS